MIPENWRRVLLNRREQLMSEVRQIDRLFAAETKANDERRRASWRARLRNKPIDTSPSPALPVGDRD